MHYTNKDTVPIFIPGFEFDSTEPRASADFRSGFGLRLTWTGVTVNVQVLESKATLPTRRTWTPATATSRSRKCFLWCILLGMLGL